jgi:rare lipoprotein A
MTMLVLLTYLTGMMTQANLYATFSPVKTNKFIYATGAASWYSQDDPGINLRTASNEIFDDARLTCAIWNLPFGQLLRVTNLDNGKSVVVRVNDRGPHKRYVQQGRVVDLTKGAFAKIGPLNQGLIPVQLELLSISDIPPLQIP